MCDMSMEPPILETRPDYFRRKKDLSFDDLAGPVAIPQNGPQNGHRISKQFTEADYSNTKAHTNSIK